MNNKWKRPVRVRSCHRFQASDDIDHFVDSFLRTLLQHNKRIRLSSFVSIGSKQATTTSIVGYSLLRTQTWRAYVEEARLQQQGTDRSTTWDHLRVTANQTKLHCQHRPPNHGTCRQQTVCFHPSTFVIACGFVVVAAVDCFSPQKK